MADAAKGLTTRIAEVRKAQKEQREKMDQGQQMAQSFVMSCAGPALFTVYMTLQESQIEPRIKKSNIPRVGIRGIDSLGDRAGFESSLRALVPALGYFIYSLGARVNRDGTVTVFRACPTVNDFEITNNRRTYDIGPLKQSAPSEFNYSNEDVIRDFTASLKSFMEQMGKERPMGEGSLHDDDPDWPAGL